MSVTNSYLGNRHFTLSDVRCGAGFTLVGYSFYPCDTETGVLATILVEDASLAHHSACVADENIADVCSGVNVRSCSSFLLDNKPIIFRHSLFKTLQNLVTMSC